MPRGLFALALVLLPEVAVAAPVPKTRPKFAFVGTWETTYGAMTLAEKGGEVSGMYGGRYTLTGTVKDGKYTFTYDEVSVTGEGEFVLSEDGTSFTGKWRAKGMTDWHEWTGKRTEPEKNPK